MALGLEAYSEIEDLAHAGSFEEQEHRAGPVIYFKLGEEEEKDALAAHEEDGPNKPEWKLAAGALFGLSEATSDVTFKLDAEVEC